MRKIEQRVGVIKLARANRSRGFTSRSACACSKRSSIYPTEPFPNFGDRKFFRQSFPTRFSTKESPTHRQDGQTPAIRRRIDSGPEGKPGNLMGLENEIRIYCT
jgi:hypothetical protein